MLRNNTYDWRVPLADVIPKFGGGNTRNIQIAVWQLSNNWSQPTSAIINNLAQKSVSVNDFFSLERSISFNLATTLALINAVRMELIEGSVDLTPFISRVSSAFLPKLVYQLEEYGLPRMISKKLSMAGLFDFEDDNKEITDIVAEFQQKGYNAVLEAITNRHPFDEYILEHFFDGIRHI